jgi:uncharacterized lipoprotein YajG
LVIIKKMKNRILALIPVALVAVFVLAGCSGSSADDSAIASPPPKTDPSKPAGNDNAASEKPAETL